VIEVSVRKAHKGRVGSRYPCQTLSFKEKGGGGVALPPRPPAYRASLAVELEGRSETRKMLVQLCHSE